MRVLLLIPPMTQLNTPYPSTAYLTGFLRKNGVDAIQADPAIELVLRIFSRPGLEKIAEVLSARKRTTRKRPPAVIAHFLDHAEGYFSTIDSVIQFLQGKDPSLALRIISRGFLPEGPRFNGIDQRDGLDWAFGALGIQDRAKYLATLYIDDLADVVNQGIDGNFELSRYGERLAASVPTFEPLADALSAEPTLVDQFLEEITRELIVKHKPDLVGLSVPFPGNVYGALSIARTIRELPREHRPSIVMGGGYVNTELRELAEPRLFDYVDFITLDDGERPLLSLIEHLRGSMDGLFRTLVRENGKVVLKSDPSKSDVPHKDVGTPCYDGLPMDRYLSIFEMLNPMHRIWSDGRWNKLTVAHGCYWRKCNFCDVTLNYIGQYDVATADVLVDRIEEVSKQTGQTGFHLVDEAAPPAALRALAERLIARRVVITWWGNIRFEKAFTPELVRLLARSGCVAVSGGLEVASDRLLKLINKGVSVEQVAAVTRAFVDAGIMVHAYLMYGVPTQTEQETIDALERVRQLFAEGCIQSAYWHRFSVTAHSPIGKNPEKFGIQLVPVPKPTFALNDLAFTDPTGCDHEALGVGLRKALYNYMHGVGLDQDVRVWFDKKVPKAKVPKDLISRVI